MTPIEADADLNVLKLANELGKFAIEVGYSGSPLFQKTFERGIIDGWFTLVDISPLAAAPAHLCRVFKLTPTGEEHKRKCLAAIAKQGGQNDAD